jgi:hypothetical protein
MSNKRIQELEAKIKQKDKEIKKLKHQNDNFWNGIKGVSSFGFKTLIGSRLNNSINELFNEISEKRLTKDTLANVTAHVLWRFTRIGLFTIFIALIPTCFAGLQTYYLYKQNEKLDLQNLRIKEQIYLQEADRRSTLIMELSNILDKVHEETFKFIGNGKRVDTLTDGLIGRISALATSLKPYKFYEKDTLSTDVFSPERGQLLNALIRQQLDSNTFLKIFTAPTDFTFSNLKGADLQSKNLRGIILQYSTLRSANLGEASLRGSLLTSIDFTNAVLIHANLMDCELDKAKFINSNLTDAYLYGSNLNEADFTGAKLEGTIVSFDNLDKVNIFGKEYINSKYKLIPKDNYWVFTAK